MKARTMVIFALCASFLYPLIVFAHDTVWPGEKLKEELITEGEGIVETSHKKIMVLKGQVCDVGILNGKLERLMELVVRQDGEGIKRAIRSMLPEYSPENGKGISN